MRIRQMLFWVMSLLIFSTSSVFPSDPQSAIKTVDSDRSGKGTVGLICVDSKGNEFRWFKSRTEDPAEGFHRCIQDYLQDLKSEKKENKNELNFEEVIFQGYTSTWVIWDWVCKNPLKGF